MMHPNRSSARPARPSLSASALAPLLLVAVAGVGALTLIAGAASCSIFNAPDDVVPGPTLDAGAGGGGGAQSISVCRNGILEAGEACDDGNNDANDACSSECAITEFDIEADPSLGNEVPGIGTSGVDDGKGFFVIWRYLGQPNEIRGRAYNANGQRVTQAPVKLSTSAEPDQARIGTTPGGRSLVAWRSFADNKQVHYRVVDPDGKAQGTDDLFFPGSQSNALVSVGANNTESLALMWMGEGDPADPSQEARVRAFDDTGSPMATKTQVLALTNGLGFPGVWGLSDGFVASWNSDDGKLGSMQVDNAGMPAGAQFSLAANLNANRNPFGAFVGPDLQFIAVFEQDIDLNADVKPRITKRFFKAPGVSDVLEDLVSMKHTEQTQSRVARFSNGNFIIVWADVDADAAEGSNIVARVFHQDGTASGAEFTVNQVRAGDQSWPGVAVNSQGDAMFVWDNKTPGAPVHLSGIIIPRLLSELPK